MWFMECVPPEKKDTCFKRGTAHLFYKLMSFLGADIVYDHADYRLLSKRATENLLDFDEVNLFLRGIVPMVGFQSTTVEYERGERFAGGVSIRLERWSHLLLKESHPFL